MSTIDQKKIERLFSDLKNKKIITFPKKGSGDIPNEAGVYILYKNKTILHVGIAKNLRKRMRNHLSENPRISSFLRLYAIPNKINVRKECGVKYIEHIEFRDYKLRRTLEIYAQEVLRPKHIGKKYGHIIK